MNTSLADAMPEALKSLVVPPRAVSLDLSKMYEPWQKCKDHYGSKLQTVPRVTHEDMIEGDYLTRNSRKIRRVVTKLILKFNTLNLGSLQGKLMLKMPPVRCPEGMTIARKQEVQWNAAALLIEILLANGVVKSHTEQKSGSKELVTIITLGGKESPVDLLYGVCEEPGMMVQERIGYQRLSPDFKEMLRGIGSWRWKFSDYMTDDLIRHFYQLSAEYNSESKYERSVARHDRINIRNIQAIHRLRKMKFFYLPMFFDDRGRLYYYFSKVFGARPQGKTAEVTGCFDLYEPVQITDAGADHLKHIIYVLLHGKVSLSYAVKHFKEADLKAALESNPLDVEIPSVPYGDKGQNARIYRKAESKFSDCVVLNKAGKALEMYREGVPCPYIFGKDLTNSGLMMAANSFLSEKMLRGCNCWGLARVADSHMQYGRAQGIAYLPREEIKDVHTPLLHGSSSWSIAGVLTRLTGEEHTAESVDLHNQDAYGAEVSNISIITNWGVQIVSNFQNIFKWKTLDGFPACHKAVMKRVPFSVYAASPRSNSKKAHIEYRVIAPMPVALDAKGKCVFGKENLH